MTTTGGRHAADVRDGILDLLPGGVAVARPDGRPVRVNRALADLLGCSRDWDGDAAPAPGWTAGDEDLPAALARLAAGPAGEVHVLAARHEDGRHLTLRVQAGPTDPADAGGARLVAVTDVTAERRIDRLLDVSPDGHALYGAVRDGEATGLVPVRVNEAGRAAAGALGDALRERLVETLRTGVAVHRRHVQDVAGDARVLDCLTARLDPDTVLLTWRDVTERVEGEQRLERAYEETADMRATLQTALDASSDGFAVYGLEWDETRELLVDLRVVHANAAGALSLGHEAGEITDMTMHELFPGVETSGLWERIVEAVRTKAPQYHRVHEFDPEGRWLSSWDNSIAPVGEERIAIYWRNVSAEESALRQLARHRDEAMHSATHDALTGLPNRILLRDHLQEALRVCAPDQRVGIVFVDLDRFKAINDTFGHAAGDAVLCASAERLKRLVRHGDLAARLAGDEFVLVLTQLAAEWTPDLFFARATDMLSEPVVHEGDVLRPGASLGVVLTDPRSGAVDVDALIKDADAAMYAAKAARRDR